jgi:hypothetical protein
LLLRRQDLLPSHRDCRAAAAAAAAASPRQQQLLCLLCLLARTRQRRSLLLALLQLLSALGVEAIEQTHPGVSRACNTGSYTRRIGTRKKFSGKQKEKRHAATQGQVTLCHSPAPELMQGSPHIHPPHRAPQKTNHCLAATVLQPLSCSHCPATVCNLHYMQNMQSQTHLPGSPLSAPASPPQSGHQAA